MFYFSVEASVAHYGNIWYTFHEGPVSWQEAFDACEDDGATLVEIKDWLENDIVKSLIGKV